MMKIVIILDVQTEALRTAIQEELKKRHLFVEIVHCCGSLRSVLRRHNHGRCEERKTFTCYITENKRLIDADVVYALYCERIPALCLSETSSVSVNLLETPSSLQIDTQEDVHQTQIRAVIAFLSFHPSRGQVFVFEGGDGAGKATQTRLLLHRLKEEKHSVATLDFPSERDQYGWLLRVILSGKKGGIDELDPKLFSLVFSLNRFACLPDLLYWMRRGRKIVLDRYYTSNYGHQASKLPEHDRMQYIYHLSSMEVQWLGLPEANHVFYLDLPPHAALKAMKNDTSREMLDIHETAKRAYKENVRQTYLWCCETFPNWFHIDCCDSDGVRLSKEKVHDVIYNAIQGKIN